MSGIKKYLTEFEWVMKVLESCKTRSQAKSTEKLFDSFRTKWLNSEIDIEKYLISHSDQFNERLKTYWGSI